MASAEAIDKNIKVSPITKEELYMKLNLREPVQLVNVLDPKFYDLGSIKGSLKIPLSELHMRLGELDRFREVITYCASYQCSASREAAKRLAVQGFNARAYEGGIKEWKEAGLPIERDEAEKEEAIAPSEHACSC